MMYRIIGTDRRSGCRLCYGEFDNLNRYLKHMGRLITAFGLNIHFSCEGVDKNEPI